MPHKTLYKCHISSFYWASTRLKEIDFVRSNGVTMHFSRVANRPTGVSLFSVLVRSQGIGRSEEGKETQRRDCYYAETVRK